jgi:DsbC/DsbD-like thiol-disulfide interchange protein
MPFMSPMTHRPPTALIFCANLVVLLTVSRPALAADASPWDGAERAAVRLIAGSQRGTADATVHRAGVEIRLAPGWKTYWRYPGDSGVPPRFDFTRSRNVKSVTVRWPAPQRLTDESGTSIGYKHDIVFPLEVVPQDAAKPVDLVLGIDYAVCEKLCVPADGKAELTIGGGGGEQDGRVAQSEALVPRPAALGANGALAIRAVRREAGSAKPRILVDVAAPADVAVALFAEGPAADWALPVPEPIAGAPAGQQRFAFELDGLPPNTKADGVTLTLTAVAGDQAIEVPFRLD